MKYKKGDTIRIVKPIDGHIGWPPEMDVYDQKVTTIDSVLDYTYLIAGYCFLENWVVREDSSKKAYEHAMGVVK